MKVKERKGWKSLNKDFQKWYKSNGAPDWKEQKRWLSKELVKREFITDKQLLSMWAVFHALTDDCSNWEFQSKVLSFITLCMDEEIGESLYTHIK